MRGRGNRCHTEVVDADGDADACNKPAVGFATWDDGYDNGTYPACTEHQEGE